MSKKISCVHKIKIWNIQERNFIFFFFLFFVVYYISIWISDLSTRIQTCAASIRSCSIIKIRRSNITLLFDKNPSTCDLKFHAFIIIIDLKFHTFIIYLYYQKTLRICRTTSKKASGNNLFKYPRFGYACCFITDYKRDF